MPARHYGPFMLDGGLTKSEGTSILLREWQQDAILGEYKMGLQLALKSSRCQTMKTILRTPCYLNQIDSTFQLKSLCSRMNTYFGGGGVTGAAGYCPIIPPSSLRYGDQNQNFHLYILSQ